LDAALATFQNLEKYQKLVFLGKFVSMAKNTSILLGEYFDNFINYQVQSGRFSSASEVVRAALRLFEQEENQKNELIKELKKGEKSGFISKFDRKKFIKTLHRKHVKDGL
jgi:antitoxin ParD1/3/4